MVDQPTLVNAMGNTQIYPDEVVAFNEALIQAGCTNVNRAAMFAAQIGHESAGLRYYEEIASGAAYEGRGDLGNTQPGDGVRFKGRGPIQVTGRRNYTVLSQWAASKGYVDRPDFFVTDPGRLSEIRYGFLGAVWYWTTQRPLNDLSDRRDLEGATRAINGGLNGIDDRRTRYQRCLAIGDALLPEGDEMAGEAQEVQTQLRGPDNKGWAMLGKSAVDPTRDNTVVEALAEVRNALLALRPSLVKDSTARFDPGTLLQLIDAATFETKREVAAIRADMAEIKALLKGGK